MSKLRQRLERQEGFTLIELLVVIVIIGILLAIAVPSYLGFKDRANEKSAKANVRAAIPAVEAYYSDCSKYQTGTATECGGTARTFDATNLKSDYDSGLKIEKVTGGASTYCISAVSGDYRAKVNGPGGEITSDKSSALPAC